MAYATRRSYAGAAPACTLTNAINSSDTSALLTGDVTNWNNTANGPFYMVIDPGLSTEEKVLVASRSGSSLSSITRGVDGTTASSHSAGATCYPVFTAVDADQANKVASTLTTKGDLLATDGSVLNRLPVGTNDYALLADSSATNGVAWKQIPAAGIASDAVTTAKILDSNVTTAKIADANVTGAKLANLTVSTKTANYTLVVGDRNTRVVMNSSSATTITVNTSVFAAGDVVWLHNIGSGTCTVTAGTATVTTSGSLALAQWGGGTLYFTSASAAIFFPAGGISYGTATGGTSSSITVSGQSYTLLTFTSDSTLTVTKSGLFDYLLVAGGGGGGRGYNSTSLKGGGGGAGGVIAGTIYLTANATVVVGAGGSGVNVTNGYASSLGNSTDGNAVPGGGRGGCYGGNGSERSQASSGGSGGGGCGGDVTIAGVSMADGITGYSGGAGSGNGGGGGGAGAAGSAGNVSNGAGGAGRDISAWLGQSSATTYKGGGGGGGGTTGGAGGTGGGGAGGSTAAGANATANSGGGGGGASTGSADGGNGGSGIVYVRFKV